MDAGSLTLLAALTGVYALTTTVQDQHRALYHRWITQQLAASGDESPALLEAKLIDLNVRLRERLVSMNFSETRLISEFAALDAVTGDISRAIHNLNAGPEAEPPPAAVERMPARRRKPRLGLLLAGAVALVLLVLFGTGVLQSWFGSGDDDRNAARPVPFAQALQLVRGFPDIEPYQAWTQAEAARLILVRRDQQHTTGYLRLGTHGIGGINQAVTVSVEGKPVRTFESAGKVGTVEVEFPWPTSGREARVDIVTDRLVKPSALGSPDQRALGVAVQGGGTR